MLKIVYLDGETPHSLVRVLQFCHCRMGISSVPSDYLFVGTHGSVILIHHILNDLPQDCQLVESEKNNSNNYLKLNIKYPLIKEIRLKHGAPIINIEVNQVCFNLYFKIAIFLIKKNSY